MSWYAFRATSPFARMLAAVARIPSPADVATKAGTRLMVWHERTRQRHHLQTLDDRMLNDIGVSRSEVEREIAKKPWRL